MADNNVSIVFTMKTDVDAKMKTIASTAQAVLSPSGGGISMPPENTDTLIQTQLFIFPLSWA